MLEKFQAGDFGHCPRVYCECQPMLPLGKLILLYESAVAASKKLRGELLKT